MASSSASGSSSQECKVGNERFCKNLNWRYKEECGKDQFSALSCKSLKTCEDLWEMAERAARCERGRELMRTKCIDKKWHDSGHQKAIDHAGDVWNDCLDLYEVAWRGCGKAPDDFFEKATKDFVKNVYTCQ